MSPVSEDHLLEFVENQDHVVVLAALQTFMDNPELLLQGLKVLLPLARPGNSFSSQRRLHGDATQVVFLVHFSLPQHHSHSFITTVYFWHHQMMMSLEACESSRQCSSPLTAGTSSH